MKTALLPVLLFVGLSAISPDALAQESTTEDQSVSRSVEVRKNNGETYVKITTTENGNTTVEEYKGEAAEEYLEREQGHTEDAEVFIHLFDDSAMSMEQMMNTDSIHKDVEVWVQQFENGFGSMDSVVKKVITMGDANFSFDFNLDSLIQELDASGKHIERMMNIQIIMIEDNEEGTTKKAPTIEGLQFYPNPTTGMLTISFELPEPGTATLTVMDLQGREVLRRELEGPLTFDEQINLSDLGKGTYLLNLQRKNESLSKKIIIQ